MNKEYLLYKDNDVIVEDEQGNKRIIEYQDNIHQLLTQENLVETLEKEFVYIENKKKETAKTKNSERKIIPAPICAGVLGCITIPTLLPHILFTGDNPIVDSIFGPMPIYTLNSIAASSICIPFFGLLSISVYHDYKISQKQEKGLQAELSFLKQILDKEKDRLNELKIKKTDSRSGLETEFKCIKIKEPEEHKTIKDSLNLYYDCGYNENKYLKFYQKGILKIKLQKSYTPSGIKMIEDYMEEKTKEKLLIKR